MQQTIKKSHRNLVAIAAVAALALTAVIGSVSARADAAASKGNIVQTAAAAGSFKTLISLTKQAGLVGALEGKGPLTVFAPTDAAFAKVPKSTLAALAKDKAKLRAVLLYHVAKGNLTASKIVQRRSVKTLNGESVRIRVSGNKVRVGGALVVTPDVKASNGVIHVINRVLIP